MKLLVEKGGQYSYVYLCSLMPFPLFWGASETRWEKIFFNHSRALYFIHFCALPPVSGRPETTRAGSDNISRFGRGGARRAHYSPRYQFTSHFAPLSKVPPRLSTTPNQTQARGESQNRCKFRQVNEGVKKCTKK